MVTLSFESGAVPPQFTPHAPPPLPPVAQEPDVAASHGADVPHEVETQVQASAGCAAKARTAPSATSPNAASTHLN
jgi:hypothetical protein